MTKIAPSILSADFSKLGEEIARIEKAGADWVHIDVMDGHFVPNLTFGPPVIKDIRKVTDMFFDCHLMIDNPSLYIDDFVSAGVDLLTVHIESEKHINRLVNLIKSKTTLRGTKMMVGVSLNPSTPLCMIEEIIDDIDMILLMSVNPGFGNQKFIFSSLNKIQRLKKMLISKNSNALIEVDGGINIENAEKIIAAGADIIVAGSAVYGSSNIKETISKLRGNI